MRRATARLAARAAVVALCAVLAPRPAAAQQADPWDWRARGLTRQELSQLLARYQAALTSSAYSEAMRTEAARSADSIQARMRDGDFRPGDRLKLTVEGQAQLSDTFTVSAGPRLVLPVVGAVSLKGVLRSELESHLTWSVDSVYRGVPVRAEPLLTLVVLGGVGKPGFYSMKSDAVLEDVIRAAGGLAPTAQLPDTYILRGRSRLFDADSVQVAMRDRRTVSSLGLRPGDEVFVPVQAERNYAVIAQVASYLVTLPFSIYTLFNLIK
jgi:polysaccharide biosynthesis/export protein